MSTTFLYARRTDAKERRPRDWRRWWWNAIDKAAGRFTLKWVRTTLRHWLSIVVMVLLRERIGGSTFESCCDRQRFTGRGGRDPVLNVQHVRIFEVVLCVAGIVGPVVGNMRLQLVGVLGYALVLPVTCFMLAKLFRHAPS